MSTDTPIYLAYLHTPYDESPTFRFFRSDGIAEANEVSLQELAEQYVVSYELPTLAPYFSELRVPLPQRLVDVTEAARLASGKPSAAWAEDPSTIWALLRRQTQYAAAANQLQNLIFRHGGRTDLSDSGLQELMSHVLRGLSELWERIREQLDDSGELPRFEQVEQPAGLLLLRAQQLGIRFDRSQVNQRLGELGEKITRAAAALRLTWNVRKPTDSAQLVAALGYDKRIRDDELLREPALARVIRARLDAALDFLPDDHALASQIKQFRAASHDKAILLHLSARPTDRIHPAFSVVGTVTARPLARTPAIQYLSKAMRSILRPDEGKVFLYPDFAQFEPGILAEDSGDGKLIDDFNSGDLYATLSQRVFGAPDRRDHAKLIFLAFCYGMSVQRAAQLISPEGGVTSEIEALIATFFDEYRLLQPWVRHIHEQLLQRGRIGSRFGNYRYRVRPGRSLDGPERRWSLSQRIQGTASLILKRAMLNVERIGCGQLLLPMHDAALYQVDISKMATAKAEIERAFISAYVDECPHLRPRVKFEPFSMPSP